jgi:hypothetical protein
VGRFAEENEAGVADVLEERIEIRGQAKRLRRAADRLDET